MEDAKFLSNLSLLLLPTSIVLPVPGSGDGGGVTSSLSFFSLLSKSPEFV